MSIATIRSFLRARPFAALCAVFHHSSGFCEQRAGAVFTRHAPRFYAHAYTPIRKRTGQSNFGWKLARLLHFPCAHHIA
jgi:hypothetical protein